MTTLTEKYKNAYIISPNNRALDLIYYCDLLFNFKSIKFKNENLNNFSNLVIVDQALVDKINTIKKPYNYKFLVFIWNGNFSLEKYKEKFLEIEKKNKIKLNYFIVGSFHEKRFNYFSASDYQVKKLNRKIKIEGLNGFTTFKYQYSIIYSIICALINPLFFLKKILFSKVIFLGFGIIKYQEIKTYASNNDIDHNYKNLKKYFWEELAKNYYENNNIKKSIKLFRSIEMNEDFQKLDAHKKYYLIQNFFRHIFLSIFENFKNFEWMRRENKLVIYHSPFYKKNYFIDFGCKCSSDLINPRYLFLQRNDKKIINLNFFKNISFENSEYITDLHKSIEFLNYMHEYSKKNKKNSSKKLAELISYNYKRVDK